MEFEPKIKVFLKPWWKNYLPWNWKSRKATQEIITYQDKIIGEDIRKLTTKCILEGREATDDEIAELGNRMQFL